MTTDHNAETRTASADSPTAGQPPRPGSGSGGAFGWARRAAADAGRASAPTIKRIGARIGDWLATVGWAKFFLVALLLLIVGAIADNVFYKREPVVVVKMREGEDRVQVNLQVAPDGVRIQAPTEKRRHRREVEGRAKRQDRRPWLAHRSRRQAGSDRRQGCSGRAAPAGSESRKRNAGL